MTGRIAFYAPMKSPDHPAPSGDRTVGRLYRQALQMAGFAVETVSALRSFDGAGDGARQQALGAAAAAERAALIARLRNDPPALWFTYHCHYKAPDLLGPLVTAALGIPYVIAEPSFSPCRAPGPWATFHAASASAISVADLAIVVTERDRPAVAALRGSRPTLHLPPFLDLAGMLDQARHRAPGAPLRLIAVGMMRHGDKLASYRVLAEALGMLPPGWHLTIIGDGAARGAVEALFAPYTEHVVFAGQVDDRAALAAQLAAADLMVWPAVGEAYGMALLEAQAFGVPVVAGRGQGVGDVVRDGVTGVLVETGDAAGFAAAIAQCMAAPERLAVMGRAAGDFVRGERTVEHAAAWLRGALAPLGGDSRCAS